MSWELFGPGEITGFVQISAWPCPYPGGGHLWLHLLFLHLKGGSLLCEDRRFGTRSVEALGRARGLALGHPVGSAGA